MLHCNDLLITKLLFVNFNDNPISGRPQINSSINYTFSFFHPYEEIFEPLDQSQNYTGTVFDLNKIYVNNQIILYSKYLLTVIL